MDFLLLLPVDTRFLISLRTFDPGSLVGVLTGFSVMGYALLADGAGSRFPAVPGIPAAVAGPES